MVSPQDVPQLRQLTTPRAAAVAGIAFGVLFATVVVLLGTSVPHNPSAESTWVEQNQTRMSVALVLTPFAGIAFLWFIGVVRDRLGALEDRFFATVLLGSGLLFLAMIFVSTSIGGGVLALSRQSGASQEEIIFFGRDAMVQINSVYAVRMAAVFMISLGTIWLRTGLMPRWLVFVTYVLALALLLIITVGTWVALVFPIWVLVISVSILLPGRRSASIRAG